MNSIKRKLVKNFLIVILSTIGLLNLFIGIFIKNYYYDNIEQVVESQLIVSTNFYNKYFSGIPLKVNVYRNVDSFWNEINAQVQVIDYEGNLLMDSLGVNDKSLSKKSDIKKSLNGETSRWIGKVDYTDKKVMAVSHPINVNGKIEGVLRFIISLDEIDKLIFMIQIFFIGISIFVFIIGVILTILVANKIIRPIKDLTSIAELMAHGNLEVRNKINDKDEVGKLAQTFNYMADEISKREQLKNDFISSVSHELRTPLTAIKGWAITLNSNETDKKTLKVGFNIIEQETERLSNMVEELLDFSRLVGGKIELRLKETNIGSLIQYIETYMKPRAIRDNINFRVETCKDDLGVAVIDEDRIKQVLLNLLDNSFKFSNIGSEVILRVDIINSQLRIIVEDNGCGISKEDLPKVKEKFYKGKNSKSRNGIGLSICDEIIKLHNGQFHIDSEVGTGTNITVIIPLNSKEEYYE